jgi:lysophospholipase
MRTTSFYDPVIECDWWHKHCEYSHFNRQGIDIVTASFRHPSPKAAVVLMTGWSESFLKYAEVIRAVYEQGFSVFTFDHQSQGLSGRWLPEPQSTWVHSFEGYVDDFVYFVTMINRERPHLPVYLLAHSMGGLIACIAMSRLPTLITRAVLSAPMLRNKCGLKCFDYRYPLPQPIAYWATLAACGAGLGTMNALGFFREDPADDLKPNITTSNREQLRHWQALRQKYPSILSTCVTNDWLVQSIRAQKKFSRYYEFVGTNTLIVAADPDREVFVYNRAMGMFANKAPNCRVFVAPGAYHEVLFEHETIRGAALKAIIDFFTQQSDSVDDVRPSYPLTEWDKSSPTYSPAESLLRSAGIAVAILGAITGAALILSGGRR